jgi:hypothetical protein
VSGYQRPLAGFGRSRGGHLFRAGFLPALIVAWGTGAPSSAWARSQPAADPVSITYLQLGDGGKVLRHLKSSLRLNPRSAMAHYNIGERLRLYRGQKAYVHDFATGFGR